MGRKLEAGEGLERHALLGINMSKNQADLELGVEEEDEAPDC